MSHRNSNKLERPKSVRFGTLATSYKCCLVPATLQLSYASGHSYSGLTLLILSSFDHIAALTLHSLCWFNCEAPYFWVKLSNCSFLNKCPSIWHHDFSSYKQQLLQVQTIYSLKPVSNGFAKLATSEEGESIEGCQELPTVTSFPSLTAGPKVCRF